MKKLKSKQMKRDVSFQEMLIWTARLIAIAAIVILLLSQHNYISSKNIVYSSDDISKSFVGYRIVHLSDICNDPKNIVDKVKKVLPNIILVSGGYSDTNGNSSNTIKAINEMTEIAPVYYIYNSSDKSNEMSDSKAINISDTVVSIESVNTDVTTFIENNYGDSIIKQAKSNKEDAVEYIKYVTKELEKSKNNTISLVGISTKNRDINEAKDQIHMFLEETTSKYNIALIPYTDMISEICKTDISSVFVGGTFSHKIDSKKSNKDGTYTDNGTQIFISNGIGTPKGKKRIFNYPSIQVIVLSDGTIKKSNPLEEFIKLFYKDVGTIFDNDSGFTKYRYEYTNEQ